MDFIEKEKELIEKANFEVPLNANNSYSYNYKSEPSIDYGDWTAKVKKIDYEWHFSVTFKNYSHHNYIRILLCKWHKRLEEAYKYSEMYG